MENNALSPCRQAPQHLIAELCRLATRILPMHFHLQHSCKNSPLLSFLNLLFIERASYALVTRNSRTVIFPGPAEPLSPA